MTAPSSTSGLAGRRVTTSALKDLGETRKSSNGDLPPAGSNSSLISPTEQLQVRRFLHIARLGDTAIAVLVLLGGFLVSNIHRMPAGLQEFLGIRVTIKNFLLVAGFVLGWRLVCVLAGRGR